MASSAAVRLIFVIDSSSQRFQEVPLLSALDFLALIGAYAGYGGILVMFLTLWQRVVKPFGVVDFYYVDSEYGNVVDRWYQRQMQRAGYLPPGIDLPDQAGEAEKVKIEMKGENTMDMDSSSSSSSDAVKGAEDESIMDVDKLSDTSSNVSGPSQVYFWSPDEGKKRAKAIEDAKEAARREERERIEAERAQAALAERIRREFEDQDSSDDEGNVGTGGRVKMSVRGVEKGVSVAKVFSDADQGPERVQRKYSLDLGDSEVAGDKPERPRVRLTGSRTAGAPGGGVGTARSAGVSPAAGNKATGTAPRSTGVAPDTARTGFSSLAAAKAASIVAARSSTGGDASSSLGSGSGSGTGSGSGAGRNKPNRPPGGSGKNGKSGVPKPPPGRRSSSASGPRS